MIFGGRRQSENVIDQRSFGAGKLGGGALIIGAIVYYLMGGNPLVYLAQNAGSVVSQPAPANSAQDDQRKEFAAVVLADTEDVWRDLFRKQSLTYQEPRMVLFRGRVESACGTGQTAMGPFYCPGDQRVYLDLSFFDELSNQLGAKGDFAGAYVIAHEVGHHVQNLLGLDKGDRSNAASVQVELQADCLAGVWARRTQETKQVLEEGDIDEAIGAASAVGDDKLQERSRGYVVPDSFTHGSAAQRTAAFKQGFSRGELGACVN